MNQEIKCTSISVADVTPQLNHKQKSSQTFKLLNAHSNFVLGLTWRGQWCKKSNRNNFLGAKVILFSSGSGLSGLRLSYFGLNLHH